MKINVRIFVGDKEFDQLTEEEKQQVIQRNNAVASQWSKEVLQKMLLEGKDITPFLVPKEGDKDIKDEICCTRVS